MANVKITDLTAYTDPVNTDVLPIVDVTNDVTKKVSVANILKNASLGTAALPGISFDGDPNTGIYSPGADQVAISTSSVGRVFVDASGNVGVGVSPTERFQVGVSNNANVALKLSNSGTSGYIQQNATSGTGAFEIGSSAAYPLILSTNSAERLRVTSAGLVGIGTSSPQRELHVVGTGRFDNGAVDSIYTGTTAGSQLGIFRAYGTGSGVTGEVDIIGRLETGSLTNSYCAIQTTLSGVQYERLRIDSSGRVGIGTTPSSLFHISGSVAVATIEGTSTSSASIQFRTNSSNRYKISTPDSSADLAFFAGGSDEAMRLDSSKRLLLGTTTAGGNGRIVVAGNPVFPTGANSFGILRLATNNTTPANNEDLGYLEFHNATGAGAGASVNAARDGGTWTSGSSHPSRLVFSTTADGASSPVARLTIKNDGSVIWGDVYGDTVGATNRDLYIDSTGLMGYVSSIRASKANINSIESPDWLYQLNPVSFNRRRKDDTDNYTDETYEELEYGLIAEEVEEVAPELCFYDVVDSVPELRGVHYTQLITPMLKALQQANQRIETLEAKVTALESA